MSSFNNVPVAPSLLLFNARSIWPKFDEFCLTILKFKLEIVLMTETWLTDRVDDNFLCLPQYNLFRKDRFDKHGGGVCL